MTSDEARAVFDDVLEGELEGEARAAFDAALAADAGLRAEWESFLETMRLVRGVGLDTDPRPSEALVEGVRTRLRVRSRGRFYRDRFATVPTRELMLPFVLAVVAFVLVAIAWGGHRVVQVAPAPPSDAGR